MFLPDYETGYFDPEEGFVAQAEEAEEARYLEQMAEAHAPNSDPDPTEPDYRRIAINLARHAAATTNKKEAA